MFARGQVLGFGTPIDINVTFDDAATRKRVSVPSWHQNADHKPPSTLYVFGDGEPARGEIIITTMPEEKQPLYTELKVEFVGQINVVCPEARTTTDFSCTCLELEKVRDPRIIECCKVWSYAFPGLPKPYESYNGITSQLRYCFRVTLKRPMAVDVVEEQEVWVQNPAPVAHPAVPIKMEVGLEKLLHIEFEYNKRNYHLQDVVLGKIYFLNIKKLQIKHMELSLLKQETTGTYHENDTIAKFEVMDGHPVNGENIPVRVFLSPYQLTPTYKQVHDMFSVKYYLNLVLVADDERRYYKQQEIVLWRKGPNTQEHAANAAVAIDKAPAGLGKYVGEAAPPKHADAAASAKNGGKKSNASATASADDAGAAAAEGGGASPERPPAEKKEKKAKKEKKEKKVVEEEVG